MGTLDNRPALEAFRRGDRAVLEAVYREQVRGVAALARFGFCARAGDRVIQFGGYRSVYEQQNVIQETFTRAFTPKARLAYDGLTSYAAYLKAIARNIVIDDLRHRGTGRDELSGAEWLDAVPDDALPQDEQLRRGALISAMREFVAELPDELQRLVRLRHEQGLHQEEVARRLKVSRSRVRTLERRVRKRLTRWLRPRGLLAEGSSDPATLSALLLLALAGPR